MELKRLRTEHSYTQEQIAEIWAARCPLSAILKNNRAKLNLRVLMYYARLCNVTVDSILNAVQGGRKAAGYFQRPGRRGAQYPASVPA